MSGPAVAYAAVIYDIEGNTAFLAESLPGELNVAKVNVTEIYGTETGKQVIHAIRDSVTS